MMKGKGFTYLILLMLHFPPVTVGQSHNYWTRSFNEESSLLSGAVVGGGAGPSAIYYNPSGISEITESKLSLHASLFNLELLSVKNALGEGIDLNSTRLTIAPRFLSYMIKPKKYPQWSFEIAFLNNENRNLNFIKNVDYATDVLTHLPGDERYSAYFTYYNRFRDDWMGIGGSWNINRSLYLGASMFVTVKTFEYRYLVDIEAFPLEDSLVVDGSVIPFYSATYHLEENVKFNNYRLLWKFGMMYSIDNLSIGVSITTPSVNIYSDGKKVSRKLKQSNITDPQSGEPLPDFVIVDYQEKNAVKVNFKSPMAFAIGATLKLPEKQRILYSTVEYFSGLDLYKMVEAEQNSLLQGGSVYESIELNEWLTVISGAEPVFNAAVGYRSYLRDDLMLMTGFRTDFNYRKGDNYHRLVTDRELTGLNISLYHLSGGLTLRIFGQDLIAGLQYTFGLQGSQEQFINLKDPVEFNYDELSALQGTRQKTMNSLYNSLSFYFGATINFGGETD